MEKQGCTNNFKFAIIFQRRGYGEQSLGEEGEPGEHSAGDYGGKVVVVSFLLLLVRVETSYFMKKQMEVLPEAVVLGKRPYRVTRERDEKARELEK